MTNRDALGRFVKGNPGGPGRLSVQGEREYFTALQDNVSLEDWAAIVKKAVTQAKAGNRWARDFLSKYILGNPEQLINVQSDRQVRVIVEHVDKVSALDNRVYVDELPNHTRVT